jgi:mannose-6-phosphate isomerase-like protein (cupin superfamily)
MTPTETPAIVHRPWGHFEVLADQPALKIKRIVVQPGGRLSLQRHRHRHEHWFVVEGQAEVEVDAVRSALGLGQSVNVPQGAWHRLANTGTVPMVLIEIQTGTSFGEDDIERAADDYGRHLEEPAS